MTPSMRIIATRNFIPCECESCASIQQTLNETTCLEAAFASHAHRAAPRFLNSVFICWRTEAEKVGFGASFNSAVRHHYDSMGQEGSGQDSLRLKLRFEMRSREANWFNRQRATRAESRTVIRNFENVPSAPRGSRVGQVLFSAAASLASSLKSSTRSQLHSVADLRFAAAVCDLAEAARHAARLAGRPRNPRPLF